MQILIVDLGSQYTPLISRRIRELGVKSTILSPAKVEEWLRFNAPKGIILSGGDKSVYDEDAPMIPRTILSLGIPILGICYGMQALVQEYGGRVVSVQERREYGIEGFVQMDGDELFRDVPSRSTVVSSHGDSVEELPAFFYIRGYSGEQTVAAIAAPAEKLWGLQFHPEVDQTAFGRQIFKNFLSICGVKTDWNPREVILEIQEKVCQTVPPEEPALLAFSGGVDSTVLAKILSPILRDRLCCVTLDGGQLRTGEIDEIHANASAAGVATHVLDHRERFLEILGCVVPVAKPKRLVFQQLYWSALGEYAAEHGIRHLIHATLQPDIIESAKVGEAAEIKIHHNAGMASWMTQHHPLQDLFKDEVRELGRAIGLPSEITGRMPFPGPGLFCRIVGAPITPELVEIVRWADYEVRQILQDTGILREISQLVVALVGVETTGVKGDAPVYSYPIVVRAVYTMDFMTAVGQYIPKEIQIQIIHALTKHNRIGRVWFDPTDKPPATIEFE